MTNFTQYGFSEEASKKANEILDFTRCERPDGTAYGTSGKCRKGTETAKQLDQRIARQEKWLRSAQVRGQIPAREIAIERKELETLKKERELTKKIDKLHKQMDKELNSGNRDWALRLNEEAGKLIKEKADLRHPSSEG